MRLLFASFQSVFRLFRHLRSNKGRAPEMEELETFANLTIIADKIKRIKMTTIPYAIKFLSSYYCQHTQSLEHQFCPPPHRVNQLISTYINKKQTRANKTINILPVMCWMLLLIPSCEKK